jgi:hypothetical protein
MNSVDRACYSMPKKKKRIQPARAKMQSFGHILAHHFLHFVFYISYSQEELAHSGNGHFGTNLSCGMTGLMMGCIDLMTYSLGDDVLFMKDHLGGGAFIRYPPLVILKAKYIDIQS